MSIDLKMSSIETNSYCIVFNIPSDYRSKHLRNYFNEFIEKRVFNCFHYRHRPQSLKTLGADVVDSHVCGDQPFKDAVIHTEVGLMFCFPLQGGVGILTWAQGLYPLTII